MRPHRDNQTCSVRRLIKLSNGCHFRFAVDGDPSPTGFLDELFEDRAIAKHKVIRLKKKKPRSRKYGPILNDGPERPPLTRWDLI